MKKHTLLLALAACLGLAPLAARAQAPANDDPCGAVPLLPLGSLCTTPTLSTNAGATTTVPNGYFNPGQNMQVNGCGVATAPKDVWFKFTTTATGLGSFGATLTVSGNPAGLLRLFAAPSCAGPFAQVQCSAGTANNSVAARISTASLAAGTTYYVQVAGYGSNDVQGPFTICLTDGPGAPSCDPVTLVRDTYPAGLQPGQAVISFVPGANNVPPYTLTVSGGGVPTHSYTALASPVTIGGVVAGSSVGQTVTVSSACAFGGSASFVAVLNPRLFDGSTVCNATALSVNPTCRTGAGSLFSFSSGGSGGGVPGCGGATAGNYRCQWFRFATAASGPGSTQATVALSSSTGPNELQVWRGNPCPGNALGALTLLGCRVGFDQYTSPQPLALTGLSPGTTYYVQVGLNGRIGAGGGAFTVCVTAPGGCSAPDLGVSDVGATSAVLNFAPLFNAVPPQSYTITYQAAGGPVQPLNPAATPPAAALTGLLPGTPYTVSITANCAGSGVAVPATATFTTAAAPAACADPLPLAVTNVTSGGATVSFAPVAGASSYAVTYQLAGSSAQAVVPAPTASPVVLTGLLPGTDYAVRVQALCPAGVGTAQAISFSTLALAATNDACAAALPLPVGPVCQFTQATSLGATAAVGVPAPGCASNAGPLNDVWFALVVPANGVVRVTTAPVAGSVVTDTGLALYGGPCGSLALLACNDDYTGGGRFSQVRLSGQLPGATLYARVWRYGGNGTGGPFNVCATTDATLATASSTRSAQLALYPNPAHQAVTLQVPASVRPTAPAGLYNGLGQLVRQQALAATPGGAETVLPLGGLAPGVYVLRLPTTAGVLVKRLVVE